MLLSIAQSDHERKSLRYTICSASGMTPTQACCRYGFQHMKRNAKEVEDGLAGRRKWKMVWLKSSAFVKLYQI